MFKNMFQKIQALGAFLVFSLLVGVSNASAALDWTGIALDTGDVDTVMGLVIVGLAAMWGFRKVIKTMNRS